MAAMLQLPRNNVVLLRFQFYLGDKLLENAPQNRPSKICYVSISQYSANGSSGKVVLALYHCRMASDLTPYLSVYGCLGFACIGSFRKNMTTLNNRLNSRLRVYLEP